ncbi:MAG: hypothetical protein ACR2J0_07795 [Mycobacteriales bacterium]
MEKSSLRSDTLFTRSRANPLLNADRWPYPVNAVMNAGATTMDGTTVLICRVEDRRGISHLALARSKNGVSNWVVDESPCMAPSPDHPEEEWGLEDPRVTYVEELESWVIAYTAFGSGGPAVSLALTSDFVHFERLGMVMSPEDKNAALLPRRVKGDWVLFHRPVATIGRRGDIWLSRSSDLRSWTAPEPVMGARVGGWWDSARIGMGPPPLETEDGWLVVYHGVRQTVAGALYRAGLALLDLDQPAKVLRRAEDWVLSPRTSYELVGDVPGVVFPCGLVHDETTDELRVYYGAADSQLALATASLSDVLGFLRSSPEG